ncbi:winged helix-turn-helix transcriptional regulator [Clavibacter sp. Sh2088]|uniref:winged helix-turn-helix transcriptional regulator n=1 Tax=Clavibacter sp. Sh2088 TaxID=3397676 RepID=UPI0039E0AC43
MSFRVTRDRPGVSEGRYPANCPSRTLLDHVTSKWGVLVLLALGEDSKRWGELRREIEGISEKMLASTLRTLADDGFVIREAQATIPPRVDYRLTELGHEASARLLPLMDLVADMADADMAGRAGGSPGAAARP